MDSVELARYGNYIVAHDKSLFSEFPVELFNPEYLSSDPSLNYRRLLPASTKGRGTLHVFTYHGCVLVLRHYYRGGAVSKFVKDSYLWCGLNQTRAMAELKMLLTLRHLNLPVPVPVAARVLRGSLTYRADLVTQFIPKAISLSARLAEHSLSPDTWRRIGTVIRQFHDHGCNHADLNAHNILIDEKEKVFLLDFDRAVLGSRNQSARKNNIARLRRSLLKLKNTGPSLNYSEQDFKFLVEGYRSS